MVLLERFSGNLEGYRRAVEVSVLGLQWNRVRYSTCAALEPKAIKPKAGTSNLEKLLVECGTSKAEGFEAAMLRK